MVVTRICTLFAKLEAKRYGPASCTVVETEVDDAV